MRRITRLPSFRSRSSTGYALIVLMIAVTVLLISLATALPSVYQEGQRQREEQLIFRGNEYARAIYLFQRQFHRYPSSVKELLHTNNMSFLRRAYRDPMSANGRWRLIHASANGVILDSWTLNVGNQAQTQSPLGQAQSSSMRQPFSETQTGGSTSGGAQDEASSQSGEGTSTGKQHKTPPECLTKESGPTSSFFADSNGTQGGFIAGVASCSDRASIRIFNKHDHYDEWEFLGISYLPAGLTAGTASGAPGQNQNQPGFGGTQPGSNALPRPEPQMPPLTDQPINPPGGDPQPQ